MSEFPKPTSTFADVCAVPIAELIAAYRESIDMLRSACIKEIEAHKKVEERIDPNFGDDLYLLRFVLSHHKKGLEKTKAFFLKAIEWRAQYAPYLAAIRVDLATAPFDDEIRAFCTSGLHYCTNDGHPMFILRSGIANPHAVINGGVTSEQLAEWFVLTKESAMAYCDAKSREYGRLIKVVAVQDLKGVSMYNFSRQFMNGLVASSHVSETVYPQLLRRSLMVNLPMLVRKATALAIRLMPQGLQEKVGICPETEPTKIAAYIAKEFNIHVHDLPTFLGGECVCGLDNIGCINNTPNEQAKVLTEAEAMSLPIDCWQDYVMYKLGQPPVSHSKGLPYIPEEEALKARGLQKPPVMRDGRYSGHGYVCTLSPDYRGDNASSLATLGVEGSVLATAIKAQPEIIDSGLSALLSVEGDAGANDDKPCGDADEAEAVVGEKNFAKLEELIEAAAAES